MDVVDGGMEERANLERLLVAQEQAWNPSM